MISPLDDPNADPLHALLGTAWGNTADTSAIIAKLNEVIAVVNTLTACTSPLPLCDEMTLSEG